MTIVRGSEFAVSIVGWLREIKLSRPITKPYFWLTAPGNSKRKADGDGNGSSKKKKLVRIVTYSDGPDHKPRRRKSSRKPKPKPPSAGTSANPNEGGYMLPTYSNYRQKMDAHLAAFTADMDAVFAGLQDTVASLQATMGKAQRAYETLDGYRDTLERWAEGCI